MEDIIDIVNKILEEDDKGAVKFTGKVGSLLIESIKKRTVVEAPSVSAEEFLFSEELDRKLTALGLLEKEGDFCWMPYDSWNICGITFKTKFCELLEPAFFGGVNFQMSKFFEHKEVLLPLLDMNTNLHLMNDTRNHRLMCVGVDWDTSQYMGIQQRRKFIKWFNDHVIKSWHPLYVLIKGPEGYERWMPDTYRERTRDEMRCIDIKPYNS